MSEKEKEGDEGEKDKGGPSNFISNGIQTREKQIQAIASTYSSFDASGPSKWRLTPRLPSILNLLGSSLPGSRDLVQIRNIKRIWVPKNLDLADPKEWPLILGSSIKYLNLTKSLLQDPSRSKKDPTFAQIVTSNQIRSPLPDPTYRSHQNETMEGRGSGTWQGAYAGKKQPFPMAQRGSRFHTEEQAAGGGLGRHTGGGGRGSQPWRTQNFRSGEGGVKRSLDGAFGRGGRGGFGANWKGEERWGANSGQGGGHEGEQGGGMMATGNEGWGNKRGSWDRRGGQAGDSSGSTLHQQKSSSQGPGAKQSTTTPEMRCFRCSELGHMASDCQQQFSCYICKGVGHISNSCPKKKQPPKAQLCGHASEENCFFHVEAEDNVLGVGMAI